MPDKPSLSPRPIEKTLGGGIVATVFLYIQPHMPNFQLPNTFRSWLPMNSAVGYSGVCLVCGLVYGSLVGCSHWLALKLKATDSRNLIGKAIFLIGVVGGFVVPFAVLLKRS